MKQELKEMLDKIKTKQITFLSERDYNKFTLEDLLSKDEFGISFIENVILNNVYIMENDIIKKSPEIAYIYLKNNQSIYFFDLSEESLFKTFDEKTLIEIIIEKNNGISRSIGNIKNNIEVIDLLIKNNSKYNLEFMSKSLAEKLLIPNDTGIYPIEKYLNDEDAIKYIIKKYDNPEKIIDYLTNKNKITLLKHLNKTALLYKINENTTSLEWLLNQNIIPKELNNIDNNAEFLNLLLEKELYSYLNEASDDTMLVYLDGKKTLIDKLLEKDKFEKTTFKIYKKEIIQKLYERNKLNLIDSEIDESIYLEEYEEVLNIDPKDNHQTFLEYLIDNGYNPKFSWLGIKSKEIIKILYQKEKYNILGENIKEEDLLTEIDGKCILDTLLEKNVYIKFLGKHEAIPIEIIKKIYQHKRYDLLTKADINTLLSPINENENKTYLDEIIEQIKQNKSKINLIDIKLYKYSNKEIARFYIELAKNDMIMYVEELDDEELLERNKEKNQKSLLEELLELSPDLTVNKILTYKNKRNLEIALILKSKGYDQSEINIIKENLHYQEDYLNSFQNRIGIGPLQNEGEILLKRLEELLKNDGKSDHKLIDALINSYRNALIINYDLFLIEVKKLIKIKEENPKNLVYQNNEEAGAYFSSRQNSVFCNNSNVGTLLHETSHALHYYLTDYQIPKEYYEIVKRTRNNQELLRKTNELSEKINKIKDQLRTIVEKKAENYFAQIELEDEQKINEYLKKSIEERKQEFLNLGIEEEIISELVKTTFTTEQYKEHKKRAFIEQNIDAIMREEFGLLAAMSDILDAIYSGNLHSGVLKNENGELIKKSIGHGIAYYSTKENGFKEMIANFGAIIKSNNQEQSLKYLKELVGDELYNLLMNFYLENILEIDNSKNLLNDEPKDGTLGR